MAESKTSKVYVTNMTDGPKVLNAIPVITLQAGQATDGEVEISEGELAAAKATEWFAFGKTAAKATEAPKE